MEKSDNNPEFITTHDSALPVSGIRLAATSTNTRYKERDDLALLEINADATIAAVFTQNRFCAAPVKVAKEHLEHHSPRYLVVNAGNANAGTGTNGEQAASTVCQAVAQAADVEPQHVLPFSTGVIGEQLNADAIVSQVPELFHNLRADAWPDMAAAILTTDTSEKISSITVRGKSAKFVVTGIAKGSGMIKPNMATMLAYIATDAAISRAALEQILSESMAASFNRITVDGDTSTNDACVLIATGTADGSEVTDPADADFAVLKDGVAHVAADLARAIVQDGEGATKFVTINVHGGESKEACTSVAYTVAESPLVKTALFASDPNWGRILAAVGRAPGTSFDIAQVSIWIGAERIIANGEPARDYVEARAAEIMAKNEIVITIEIGEGAHTDTVWTCDFSYDYVRINAEYRS